MDDGSIRVILEKEKSVGKVFLFYSALSEYFPLHPKKSLVFAELVPDLPGAVKFYFGLIERCVMGLVSHADVNRGLSRVLSGA